MTTTIILPAAPRCDVHEFIGNGCLVDHARERSRDLEHNRQRSIHLANLALRIARRHLR
jgi:hypothetical protein